MTCAGARSWDQWLPGQPTLDPEPAQGIPLPLSPTSTSSPAAVPSAMRGVVLDGRYSMSCHCRAVTLKGYASDGPQLSSLLKQRDAWRGPEWSQEGEGKRFMGWGDEPSCAHQPRAMCKGLGRWGVVVLQGPHAAASRPLLSRAMPPDLAS